MKKRAPITHPSEHLEQARFVLWTQLEAGKHPTFSLVFSIPNHSGHAGAQIARWNAGNRLKAEGRKRGVPDLLYPVARGRYHGLFIEMKRVRGGSVDADQRAWHQALREQGYAVVVCKGAEAAKAALLAYETAGECTGEEAA